MHITNLKNYIIDFLAFIAFIFSAASGFVLSHFTYRGIPSSTFLFITRYSWRTFHKWSSFAFIFLIFIHLILHWRWIVTMTKQFFSRTKNIPPTS